MRKYIQLTIAIILSLSISLIIYGCSYKEIEDSIKKSWNDITTGEESDTTFSEVQPIESSKSTDYHVSTSFPWDTQITFAAIGESLSGYYELTVDNMDEIFLYGTKGLEYTVQNVEIYENVFEAGISESDVINTSEQELRNATFMLVEVLIEFSGNDTATDERITIDLEATTDMDSYNMIYPKVVYFSEHPTDNNIADPIHQYFTMPRLRSGEGVNVRLGIISQPEFVKEKRVFLAVGPFRPFGEANARYFDLFSEERG